MRMQMAINFETFSCIFNLADGRFPSEKPTSSFNKRGSGAKYFHVPVDGVSFYLAASC